MSSWFRLIFSVFALAGLLAAGTGGAFAGKNHQHRCPEMSVAMTVDHEAPGQAGDNYGGTPDCCMMGVCALTAPVPAPQAYVVAPGSYAQAALPAIDDAGPPSFSVSPGLRPPIA
ncbi:hypothetical protein [Rhodoblastus sp.]|uniref:hypothetical protein n=1 Tax=Rhodoblastus sp. TaxID=1962975 RepID=UPI00260BDC4B|nr:hypothetical protein [Rhodoblastus sp.]